MIARPHIVIAGGSGFLGQALTAYFLNVGGQVTVLTRSPGKFNPAAHVVLWNGRTLGNWADKIDGAAAVINLTGRSVNCRYNPRNRREILDSRLQPTLLIGQAIAQCRHPPPVWLNASTATIYKHTYGPAWTEAGEIGPTPELKDTFSIEVAAAWGKGLNEAKLPRTRKIAMRTAMVFGLGGNSVFPTLRTLTRLGLGGRMTHGRQFVSWLQELDFCRAVEWLIHHPQLEGPVNLCAPNPITNAEMMRTIRDVIGMRIGLPATRWMLEVGAFCYELKLNSPLRAAASYPKNFCYRGSDFNFLNFLKQLKTWNIYGNHHANDRL